MDYKSLMGDNRPSHFDAPIVGLKELAFINKRLVIAGMCFDRSGEGGMYVLGVVQVPDSGRDRSESEEYCTPASGSDGADEWGDEDEDEEKGNEEGRTRKERSGGAVVEWKIRGARKMRSVDEPGEE
ncbi:hypothetical protein CPC08DRAFT_723746 [Agrocybe pediades]|nr:hypothetical protein CPC08DRAFT_723746 [Agrocybe pediades]